MTRSKTFKNGNSQAVRIPQELQLPYGEVEVRRQGGGLLITPVRPQSAAILFDLLTNIEGPVERPATEAQERDWSALDER